MQVTVTIPDTMIVYAATNHIKTFCMTVIKQAF